MKQLWLHIVRGYIRLGLFFYFKKISVSNANNVSKNEAVLFLANHQNALLDALLIATQSGRFSYFLTRASVFNNALVSKILKSLLMLPVYRVRDGWGNLTKNNSVFSMSAKLLSQHKAIVIFPEGSHHLNRTVRPLSKGFTRLIFETFERFPETNVQLVTVGLNYVNAEKFGDSVLINYGSPLEVNHEILENKNKAVTYLKAFVFNKLCALTTHIKTEDYESTLEKLEHLDVDFLNPEVVNQCISTNFKNCKSKTQQSAVLKALRYNLKKLSKIVLIINLFVPYFIWKTIFEPKIKEIEFKSTFRFAIAITLVPIFILLIMVLLTLFYSPIFAILYLINVLIIALLAVKL